MAKEQKEKEAKPKKKRTKRDTVGLQLAGNTNVDTYETITDGFDSSAEAMKWIRENGADLVGKTICIASMTPPRKVEIETKSVVKF